MKNDQLSEIWESQNTDLPLLSSKDIIKKAKKQRNGQFITMVVLSVTLVLLVFYAGKYAFGHWNNFALGLTLMISSLSFRLILEFVTIYRKENQLISLDNASFLRYMQKYYRSRLKINYIITPLCFAIYIIGFIKILPYLKREFSEGFYTYIVISGIISLVVLAIIIINGVIKELQLLGQLKGK